MSEDTFDFRSGLVVIPVVLRGPRRTLIGRFAVDTGATMSLLNWEVAVLLGYDPIASPERIRITTGSGVEFAPRIKIDELQVMAEKRASFPIVCHTLPASAGVNGVVGLDFFEGTVLTIDFVNKRLSLARGSSAPA